MLENLKFEYRGDMTERYMVFSPETDDGDFREKMLEENRISGYLPLKIQYEDETKLYLFDISACRSLSDHVQEEPVDRKLLTELLCELEKIFMRGKSYMLEEDNYVLHPDAMYYSPEGRLLVAYLPGYEKNIQLQLCALLSYLMDMIDVNDKASVYAYYTTLVAAREENTTFRALLTGLEEKKEENKSKEGQKEAEREPAGKNKPEKTDIKTDVKEKHISNRVKRALGYIAVFAVFSFVIAFFLLF